jgi:ABC-2 type transport system permease protein
MKTARLYLDLSASAARIGVANLRATVTWQSWAFGWLGRLITQALFFTSFGLWLGSRTATDFMATGNSIVVVCIEALVVIPLLVADRYFGALTLHVAAPANFIVSYFARNIQCPIIGIFSGTVAFFVVTAIFSVPVPWPAALLVPVLLAMIGFSAYAYGFAISSVVMRYPSVQMVALNFSYLSLMAFCGVNVPVTFWPAPLHGLAEIFPLTHGLEAVRGVLAGAPNGLIWRNAALEVLVGLGWLTVGTVMFGATARAGRQKGNLELSG